MANRRDKVLELILDNARFGVNISELARKTGFMRETVTTWVNKLEAEGIIQMKIQGTSKVYYPVKNVAN